MYAPTVDRPAAPVRWSSPAACGALVALVLVVVLLGDARINSGSDAGGKTATVEQIASHGLHGLDVGYWAEAQDPEGHHHPLIKTVRSDKGWIQVTSAIMPTASAAGRRVAGSVGALWVSILSVPLGALAAARLARQLGARDGRVAFVVVGALSPLTFYGADQWEHAPALAAGLWASVLLRERPPTRRALLVGALVGLAFVLRREAGLFLAVLVGAELLTPEGRSQWIRAPRRAVAGIAGAAAVVASSAFVDRALLGRSQGGRSADQVAQAGTDLGQRLSDGLLTTFSQYSTIGPSELLIGGLTLVGVGVAASGWRADDPSRIRLGAAMAGCGLLVRLVAGTGFVPGAFAVLPLTAAAPFLARREGRRLVVAAVVAVVATVALQWTGSLNAQWGGRYLLLPAVVVAVVAATEIERRDWRHPAALVALTSTAVLAGLGLVWHVERTNGISATLADIEAVVAPDDVVVSTHPHFAREVGFVAIEQPWLRAETVIDVPSAFDVVATADVERVRLLHSGRCATAICDRRWTSGPGDRTVDGWRSIDLVTIRWLGDDDWVLESFERA